MLHVWVYPDGVYGHWGNRQSASAEEIVQNNKKEMFFFDTDNRYYQRTCHGSRANEMLYYLDTIPVVNYQFYSDTTRILGFLCQKATAEFRGVSFELWYATELPINVSPWKLRNLPGAVLRLVNKIDEVDSRWEAVSVEVPAQHLPKKPQLLLDKATDLYSFMKKMWALDEEESLRANAEMGDGQIHNWIGSEIFSFEKKLPGHKRFVNPVTGQ